MASTKQTLTTVGIILGFSALGFGIYWFGFRRKPLPGLGKSTSSGSGASNAPEASDEEYTQGYFDLVPTIIRRIESEYPKISSGFGMAKYSPQDTAKITMQKNKVLELSNNIPYIKKLISMANSQFAGNEKEGLIQLVINYSKGLITL